MIDLLALGEKLHIARRRQGKTLRALQAETGIAYALISRVEKGQRPQVTFLLIVRLAHALGLSLDALISQRQQTEDSKEESHADRSHAV